MKKKENKNPQKKHLYYLARYSGLAFEMLGIIALGVFVGQKLDKLRNADFPLLTTIFSLLAVFVSLYLVIKSVLKNDSEP